MKFKLTLPVAAFALAALSASMAIARSPVEPGQNAAKQCFWASQISGFASADPYSVNVRVGARDVYQFEMFGRCDDVDWAREIAVRARGSSHICSGLNAEIIAPTSTGPQRCPVRTVRKLTQDEVNALPKRGRP